MIRADGGSKPATPQSALCAFLHHDLVRKVRVCVWVRVVTAPTDSANPWNARPSSACSNSVFHQNRRRQKSEGAQSFTFLWALGRTQPAPSYACVSECVGMWPRLPSGSLQIGCSAFLAFGQKNNNKVGAVSVYQATWRQREPHPDRPPVRQCRCRTGYNHSHIRTHRRQPSKTKRNRKHYIVQR